MSHEQCRVCRDEIAPLDYILCCDNCSKPMGALVTLRLPQRQYCADCYRAYERGECDLAGLDPALPF